MDSPSHITAIILAAGASTRMGAPKQLLPWRGRSLLRHAAETALASCCRPVVVVLGAHAERLAEEVNDLPLQIVYNAAWSQGVGTSIRAGIDAVQSQAQAALLMLCDQPLLTSALLDELVAARSRTGKQIVASQYAGTAGVPALFARAYFADLLALDGDVGARRVIARHPDDTHLLSFPEGEFDVDAPAEYEQVLRKAQCEATTDVRRA